MFKSVSVLALAILTMGLNVAKGNDLASAQFVYKTTQAGRQAVFVKAQLPMIQTRMGNRIIQTCDSDVFRIRVTDTLSGDSGWYTSNKGNTAWEIPGTCRISMQLAKEELRPGRLIELRTYRLAPGGNLVKTHVFSKAIPCREVEYVTVFTDGYFVYETQVATALQCGGSTQPTPPPVVVVTPPAPQTACGARAEVFQNERGAAALRVSCNTDMGMDVRVYNAANGNLLCFNESFYARTFVQNACKMSRNPMQRLDYKVEIRAADGSFFKDSGTVAKIQAGISDPMAPIFLPITKFHNDKIKSLVMVITGTLQL